MTRRLNGAIAAGGAALAVALVAIPVAVLADRDEGGQPAVTRPGGDPTRGSPSGDAGATPEARDPDVPIAWELDLSGTVSGPGPRAQGAAEVSPCDRPVWPATGTDRLAVTATIPQLAEARELVVFASTDRAVATMGSLRSAVAACPTEINDLDPTDNPEQAWDVLPADTGYDDSVTFSLTYTDGMPGGHVWQLTRVGKAIIAVSIGGEYARGSSAASAAVRLTEVTAHITPALCTYTEAGCSSESEPEPTTTGPRIPDGFPLAAGWPGDDNLEGPDHGLEGPSRVLPALTFEPCGRIPDDPAFADRLYAGWSNAEDYRARQLTTYADADAAVAAVASFLDAFRACPHTDVDEAGYATHYDVLRLGVGGESWAILARATYKGSESPFGATTVIVRVGSAVLLLDHAGHAGYPSGNGRVAIEETVADASVPIAEMCLFTDAGC